MKKIIMAVAAVVGLGLGFAQAGPSVNFDGNGAGSVNFMEEIKNARGMADDGIPEPGKPAIIPLPGTGNSLCAGPEADSRLNSEIRYSIDYSEKNKFTLVRDNLENLLANGSIEEKCKFVHGDQKRYTFPSRLAPDFAVDRKDARHGMDFGRISKGTPVCISWAFKEVCVDKTVWNNVCNLVAGACVVTGWLNGVPVTNCAPAYMVCRAVATILPECVNVPTTCLEMGEMPGFGNPGVI